MSNQNELMHYGVKGMHWGVRRYQNTDGTLTSAGKKQYRKELKEDKKNAFVYGRDATVAGRASNYAMNRTIRDEKKLDRAMAKDPSGLSKRTARLKENVMTDYETTSILTKHYAELTKKAKDHCDSLISKYGSENVKPIKYKDYKNERMGNYKLMDEKVISGGEWVASMLMTMGSAAGSSAMGLPFYFIYTPSGANQRGYESYSATRTAVANDRKGRKQNA